MSGFKPTNALKPPVESGKPRPIRPNKPKPRPKPAAKRDPYRRVTRGGKSVLVRLSKLTPAERAMFGKEVV